MTIIETKQIKTNISRNIFVEYSFFVIFALSVKLKTNKDHIMYTIDYLKTLHADYVEWNTDPGSMIMPEDTYNFDYASDDEIKNLAEIEDEDDFVDAIRELIQDFLATGTVKSFQVKDPSGKLVCEYDDEFWG